LELGFCCKKYRKNKVSARAMAYALTLFFGLRQHFYAEPRDDPGRRPCLGSKRLPKMRIRPNLNQPRNSCEESHEWELIRQILTGFLAPKPALRNDSSEAG
jgi:hypothetical protein